MKFFLLHLIFLSVSSSAFASAEDAKKFASSVSNRECNVILEILLERKSEANRLNLEALSQIDEKISNRLIELSDKEYDRAEAVKNLLIEKCFKS